MRKFLLYIIGLVSSVLLCQRPTIGAFTYISISKQCRSATKVFKASSSTVMEMDTSRIEKVRKSVDKLKKVLEREYVSFFDPMQCEYYSNDVTFDDPMTSLTGVEKYKGNVDMLASRTLLGKFLFADGGIILHSVEGGEVCPSDGSISNIITRWTLKVTVKLPWTPTARFTGISVYEVSEDPEGVLVKVNKQSDFWDSINIVGTQGEYGKVDKSIAIADFIDQLKPQNGNAAAACAEMPYELLRRGKDYEIRRYPEYTTAVVPYTRRDEAFDLLGSLTKGIEPLSPALMIVPNDDNVKKTMSWPLLYKSPSESSIPQVPQKILDKFQDPIWNDCEIKTVGSKVVAVGIFRDASVAPIVRKADRRLRVALDRDGIDIPGESDSFVKFAQYDAIFSLGKRRGEVWLELDHTGHPWTNSNSS
ncbi:MAG: hypothetical protein ACI90V_003778 [Bacillariaceae sp.]|jgi:hypothetical protein